MKTKMKRTLGIVLIVTMVLTLMPTTSAFAATKRLATPKITSVKSEGSAYVKISWNKVKGADEYLVFYSAKKNGKYSVIKRTAKRYHKQSWDGYYKVQAVSDSRNIKNSKLSKPRKGVVKHNGELIIPTLNFKGIGGKNTVYIPVSTKNYDAKYYGGLFIDRKWAKNCYWDRIDKRVIFDTPKWTAESYGIDIDMGLYGHPNQKMKRVHIDILGYNDIDDYALMNVPDFGTIVQKRPTTSEVTQDFTKYEYDINESIEPIHGYSAMKSYHDLLKIKGFKTVYFKDGGYDVLFQKNGQYINVVFEGLRGDRVRITISGNLKYKPL